MDGQSARQTNRGAVGQTDAGETVRGTDRWTDELTDGWTVERVHARTDGPTDGQTHTFEKTNFSLFVQN